MNDKIKELMIECGYAAPELAGRAKMLADVIIDKCLREMEEYDSYYGVTMGNVIRNYFGMETKNPSEE